MRVKLLIGVVSIAFVAIACSSGSPGPGSGGGASTAGSTTTTTPRITKAELPSEEFVGTRFLTNCTGQTSQEMASGRQVFDTVAGKFVVLPHPSLSGQDQLVSAACTITETLRGQQRIIYAVTAKTPSQGLIPEATHTDIYAFDRNSDKPVASARLPYVLTTDFRVGNWIINPSADGFAVIANSSDGRRLTSVSYYDADTLKATASATDTGDLAVCGALYNGYAIQHYGPGNQHDEVEFFSTTGAKVGEFATAEHVMYTDNGFLLERGADGVFYFDMTTRDTSGPIAPYLPTYDISSFVSRLSGTTHFFNELSTNSYGSVVLLKADKYGSEKYIKVYDLSAKKELYHLADQQITSLGVDLDATHLSGDYLLLSKKPDYPVIDYRSGKIVSSGWKLTAVQKYPDGWVLVAPSSNESQSAGAAYLARGGAGDYGGPWF